MSNNLDETAVHQLLRGLPKGAAAHVRLHLSVGQGQVKSVVAVEFGPEVNVCSHCRMTQLLPSAGFDLAMEDLHKACSASL